MEISLKQPELIEAVRAHICNQGINLVGKSVEVRFIATRSGEGIVTNVTVENVLGTIPGFTDSDDTDTAVETKPAAPVQLQVVTSAPVETQRVDTDVAQPETPPAAAAPAAVEAAAPAAKSVQEIAQAAIHAPLDDEPESATPAPEQQPEPVTEEATPVRTNSLFS